MLGHNETIVFYHILCCVIVDKIYQSAVSELQKEGGVLLDHDEKQKLMDNLWIQGKLNPNLIAKSASEIAKLVGLNRKEIKLAKILMVEETRAQLADKAVGRQELVRLLLRHGHPLVARPLHTPQQ